MTNTITATNKALLRRFYREVCVDWDTGGWTMRGTHEGEFGV